MLSNKTNTDYFNAFQQKRFEGSAEVIDIILDSDHADYTDSTDIGVIKFRFVNKSAISDNSDIQFARPLCPYFKVYPIQTEVVNIFSHTAPSVQYYRGHADYYYQTSVNAWGLLNLNSIPGSSKFTNPSQHTIDFDENAEIKSLKPFQGDVIMSGRYGQYFRFSSSNSKFKNQWSNNAIDGNPVTIITNTANKIPDNLRIEDINKDDCSIWMTTGQKIPVNPVSNYFKSFTTNKPKGFKEYKDSQVIISSNRLLFLSKKDSIFLNSNEYIGLSAKKSVNIDTKKLILKIGNVTVEIDSTNGITIDAPYGDTIINSNGNEVSLTDSGINIDAGTEKIYINGQMNVLYSLIPDAPSIVDVSQIGVSQTVKVGK
jgi:hypothetical protein